MSGDGSWTYNCEAGTGCVVTNYGELHIARSKGVHESSLIQAKTMVLLEAVRYMIKLGVTECTFETDSKVIAGATWHRNLQCRWIGMHSEMCLMSEKGSKGTKALGAAMSTEYGCQLDMANRMAKRGTKEKWDFSSHTYPIFPFDTESHQVKIPVDRGIG